MQIRILVLHYFLQFLILINLPNIELPILVEIHHGDGLSLEARVAGLYNLYAVVGVAAVCHERLLLEAKFLKVVTIS